MKELEVGLLEEAISRTGLSNEKSQKVIRNLRIGIEKQASKDPSGEIKMDEEAFKDLEEYIRIGANVTLDEAHKAIKAVESILLEMNDPDVKFLEDGTFKVSKVDGINFKMS